MEKTPPASLPPVETWTLSHPERGQIQVHIGTDQQLRDIDPGFPVAENGENPATSSGVPSEEESEVAEQVFLEQQLAKLSSDAPKQRVLIMIDGDPVGRLKDLGNSKLSLKPDQIGKLKHGEYTPPSPVLEAPMLKLESNLMNSWMRSIVFKAEGEPGIELDPPEGSFANKRLAAMAASPWKRVVYPLGAGLGKGGWALASLILIPMVIRFLEPVITWIRELLPDWEINIPWPDIPWPEINWPEINIPWPDFGFPDFTAPDWVLFLLEYSKVWVPILIGLVLGVLALRRHRKSQELKRRWAAGEATPNQDGADADRRATPPRDGEGTEKSLCWGGMTDATIARETEREEVLAKARAAKAVTRTLAKLTSTQKNEILLAAAEALVTATPEILASNEEDIAAGRERGLNESLIDRLKLDADRIEGIAGGLRQVAGLADPVGEVIGGHVMGNGIQMKQIRVPLGVMGMVYEARPNVTVDAFGLALKAGNVPLLRGSKSARYSNEKLVEILQNVVEKFDLPRETVQLLPCETHDSVQDLITARGLVDVVIPRGGAGLIEAVVTGATVPAIETGTGNCHFYIDGDVDLDSAIEMLLNGKTRRCSVCNATEVALLDAALSDADKLKVVEALQEAGVTVHGKVSELEAFGATKVVEATEEDWTDEYLSFDIAVAVVDGVDAAIEHIAKYTSGHTEAIASNNVFTIQKFADEVDAAAVMLNASTAFTDGEVYGMGAEIGISTQKLHARGPMALPELTSTKWILQGTGQIRP